MDKLIQEMGEKYEKASRDSVMNDPMTCHGSGDAKSPLGENMTIKNGNYVVKDSGERKEFATGAVRDTSSGKGRFDLIPAYPLFRLAKLYEAGSLKYAERNWEKGIPTGRFMDSGFRHLMNYQNGDRSEDHLAAVLWNICGLIWTQEQVRLGLLPESLLTLPEPNADKKVTCLYCHGLDSENCGCCKGSGTINPLTGSGG